MLGSALASSLLSRWSCLCSQPESFCEALREVPSCRTEGAFHCAPARFALLASAPKLSAFSLQVSHCFQQRDSHTAEYLTAFLIQPLSAKQLRRTCREQFASRMKFSTFSLLFFVRGYLPNPVTQAQNGKIKLVLLVGYIEPLFTSVLVGSGQRPLGKSRHSCFVTQQELWFRFKRIFLPIKTLNCCRMRGSGGGGGVTVNEMPPPGHPSVRNYSSFALYLMAQHLSLRAWVPAYMGALPG